MKKIKYAMTIMIVLLFSFLGFTSCSCNNTTPPPESSQFPTIYVNTNGVKIDSKETYVSALISMSNTEEIYEFSDAPADIRGRGNSTWNLEKKPYRIKFNTKQTVLDSGYKAKNWTLIANHSDKTLLRNYSAYYLASQLDGQYFAPHTWFVDLYLNDEYQGVYMLSDHMEENDGRVEVKFKANPEDSEYLLEWDGRAPNEGIENTDYVVVGGKPFAIKFPDVEDMTPEHIQDLKSFLTSVNTAINNADYEEIQRLIDIDSFVDYFLVQEIFKNVDVGGLSLYLQIKKINGVRKIVMGPVWDFDISCGNADYVPYEPTGLWAQTQNNWFNKLMTTPFADIVAGRWNEIKDNQIKSMLSVIAYMAVKYQNSFENNFDRWEIMGKYVWPNPQEVVNETTYMDQVRYLLNWLETRIDWLDNYYNSLSL